MDNKQVIPIFFAVDDGYIPFLAVSIQSLADHASDENQYVIKVLYTNISEENQKKISKYERENISIEFVDLNYYIEKIKDKLYTRDYYSKTTYFRLFIPNLYPQYNKVLYLDSDITILSDVADLYNIDIGDNLIAAAPDDVIQTIEVFQDYVEKVVGVADYRNYFNAGIIVMNLDELRKFDKSYINDTKSKILKKIAKQNNCIEKDIVDVFVIKDEKGINAIGFQYKINNEKYSYYYSDVTEGNNNEQN